MNGHPLPHGHRYKTQHDFGYVALNILYMYPEDSGVYTVVAKNEMGETFSQVKVECTGKASMVS